jgi:hypothetical protein
MPPQTTQVNRFIRMKRFNGKAATVGILTTPTSADNVLPHPLLIGALLLLHATAASATGQSANWRNAWHLAPGATPAKTATGTETDLPASLRVVRRAGVDRVWLDNHLNGPVQVQLRPHDANGELAPPSLQQVLSTRQQVQVSGLSSRGSDADGMLQMTLQAVPGAPDARPRNVIYQLPFDSQRIRVDQGFAGHFSHRDAENRHALDFPLTEGTPVLAARAGTVMQVIAHHRDNHRDPARSGSGANLIRILHDDGSMAVYAHLRAEGAAVRAGERVATGQPIGWSGDTGYSTGPHLHFAVQVNRGLRLESIPFRLNSPRGELRFPRVVQDPPAQGGGTSGGPL